MERFDYPRERLFCARCGSECVPCGHLTSRFLLCPNHGEFTVAPVVVQQGSSWWIHHQTAQDRAMWRTCRALDAEDAG